MSEQLTALAQAEADRLQREEEERRLQQLQNAEMHAAQLAAPWGAAALTQLAHKKAVEKYIDIHKAGERAARAGVAVKRFHHERVVQEVEVLILDAQMAQLKSYIKKGGGKGRQRVGSAGPAREGAVRAR